MFKKCSTQDTLGVIIIDEPLSAGYQLKFWRQTTYRHWRAMSLHASMISFYSLRNTLPDSTVSHLGGHRPRKHIRESLVDAHISIAMTKINLYVKTTSSISTVNNIFCALEYDPCLGNSTREEIKFLGLVQIWNHGGYVWLVPTWRHSVGFLSPDSRRWRIGKLLPGYLNILGVL